MLKIFRHVSLCQAGFLTWFCLSLFSSLPKSCYWSQNIRSARQEPCLPSTHTLPVLLWSRVGSVWGRGQEAEPVLSDLLIFKRLTLRYSLEWFIHSVVILWPYVLHKNNYMSLWLALISTLREPQICLSLTCPDSLSSQLFLFYIWKVPGPPWKKMIILSFKNIK